MSFYTAQEAFEKTKNRSQQAKEEQKDQVLRQVLSAIDLAINDEQYSCSFTASELKPFTGVVVDFLKTKNYVVTASATGIKVSWLLTDGSLTKATVGRMPLKKAVEQNADPYHELMSEDDHGFDDLPFDDDIPF